MKKLKKLAIKKITLQDLDDPSLLGVAGAATVTCATNCATCPPRITCGINTCDDTVCATNCNDC